MTGTAEIEKRKTEHLDLCIEGDVEGRRSTLLEDVGLFHEALPELDFEEIDPEVELLGRKLRIPVVITGMTGGTQRAGEVNRVLADLAARYGLGLGLGSQRAMLARPELAATYDVRRHAPDALLLANLGVVQAGALGTAQIADLVEAVAADALCVHLNVAQELAQDEGDRSFRGGLETIERLVSELAVPVIVKETGCGLAPRTLARLRASGVGWVDVAGAGGTSWPGVEALRGSARQRAIGTQLREWGIPTAPAISFARRAGLSVIASGGVRGAHDVVRALALGASAAGMALPFLRVLEREGVEGLEQMARALDEGIRAFMLLCGVARVAELARVPRVIGPTLSAWLGAGATPESSLSGRDEPSRPARPKPPGRAPAPRAWR